MHIIYATDMIDLKVLWTCTIDIIEIINMMDMIDMIRIVVNIQISNFKLK